MSEPGQAIAVSDKPLLPEPRKSLIMTMAAEYDMEPNVFIDAIKQVVFPPLDRKGNPPTVPQMAAYLAVCHQYGLSPFVKQLWPFPVKDGGFVPATSYDGWLFIGNSHPQFDGDEYIEENDKDGNLLAGVITIYRKDRSRPTVHREYLREWKRDTENWRNQPHHMLELRVRSQGFRKAFGITNLWDADDIHRAEAVNITAESAVLERSTDNAKEELKKKIGAKKGSTPEQIVTTPGASGSANVVSSGPVVTSMRPPEAPPAPTVIAPQAPAQAPVAEPKVSDEQRKAFIAKATAKAEEIKATEDQAKAKMREIIFGFGCTKYVEIPASKFDESMALLEAWKIDVDI
jgi:hypothetical protein